MAYDERLVERLREVLATRDRISEKKMFGGVAFLLDGKMFLGVNAGDLMVRVGPAGYERALARPHARPMDFTGRPLTGYVYVAEPGYRGAGLARWANEAADFVATVPAAKKPRPPRPRARPPRRQPRTRNSPSR
ncbi:MAG: TfoX/Sxy family protein [Deltaproteobacteria bacterium]|nr:TfoX/Sxy family protein [Kofleriaceae bacterium]